jgi:hypothetical protein
MNVRVPVKLDNRSYDIHVGPGLLAQAGALVAPFARFWKWAPNAAARSWRWVVG